METIKTLSLGFTVAVRVDVEQMLEVRVPLTVRGVLPYSESCGLREWAWQPLKHSTHCLSPLLLGPCYSPLPVAVGEYLCCRKRRRKALKKTTKGIVETLSFITPGTHSLIAVLMVGAAIATASVT